VVFQAKYRVIYDEYGTNGLKKGVPNRNGRLLLFFVIF
jgi:hypothetical protein